MNFEDHIAFVSRLGALKDIERYRGQFYWRDYPERTRYDSVADHSWRLAMLVLTIHGRLSQPIDLEKAITMALIHDVPEIIAGDESPLGTDGTGKDSHAFSDTQAANRHVKERAAAKELFGTFADGDRLFAIWLESEEMKSFEARLIKALDKIEAMLQVLEYRNGNLFPQHLEFTTSYGLKYADVDPAVRAFGEQVANKLRERFIPFVKEQ